MLKDKIITKNQFKKINKVNKIVIKGMKIKSDRKKIKRGWNHKKKTIFKKLSQIKQIAIKRTGTEFEKKKLNDDEIEKKYLIL